MYIIWMSLNSLEHKFILLIFNIDKLSSYVTKIAQRIS